MAGAALIPKCMVNMVMGHPLTRMRCFPLDLLAKKWDKLLIGPYERCEHDPAWYLNVKPEEADKDSIEIVWYKSGDIVVAVALMINFGFSHIFVAHRPCAKGYSIMHYRAMDFPFGPTVEKNQQFLLDLLEPAELPKYMGSGSKMMDDLIESILRG